MIINLISPPGFGYERQTFNKDPWMILMISAGIDIGSRTIEIARGLHIAVVKRAVSMLRQVSREGPVVFTGGVANNPFMVQLLAEESKREIWTPDLPEMNGAVGAALLAQEMKRT